ncbi:glycoside hydrolase family 32 protein [Halobacillus mangrovi]|uniref:Glycoside hydrolase n=1 Tax=Halobacillus mangrovi TaxID=402384 RepID=A0A1W5ZSN7_9BACI|nr:glycoside hydrolase family 32 protein [Halobacillus mangrovi]ARI76330.1 hypothetical protein HM131_05535 [Halobacillus mangrovi]
MSHEKFRPQYHFSPRKNWINDPNGLCYFNGEYHLFYQYHPHSKVWGPMHWGHAVSTDLIQWEHLPVALYPDELGQIFSGSVVVDHLNTSGLQVDQRKVMVAIFTHHKEGHETQSIAYSRDEGRTWEKYHLNPVLDNPGLKDFRDPKVFWNETHWVMSLACGDHIRFYRSEDLLNWTYLSSFGHEYGAHGGVWECPDLIRFQTDAGEKWVLIVSINPGGPNGGSAIQYFTGSFDGKMFKPDQSKEVVKWADYGRDFYAAVTWSNLAEPLWIGWMNNWQYANEGPTHPFRGSMSIPRKLYLKEVEGKTMLVQKPIEVTPLLKERTESECICLKPEHAFSRVIQRQSSFQATIKSGFVAFDLSIKGEGEQLTINFNPFKQCLKVDRTGLKLVQFSKEFASVDSMSVKYVNDFHLFIDECSIEIFINQGTKVMTELFYMNGDSFTLEWKANKTELQAKYRLEEISSIYEPALSHFEGRV